ncbi:hypothetical protein GJAV_G00163190 [Gymnothorax javanicus]|nr:hypothetical protein GJAV_G00163190 [Gymnothorax javanicus]
MERGSEEMQTNDNGVEKSMDEFLKSKGFYRKKIAKDGSCLFRAVAEQVLRCQSRHTEVRATCVEYLKRNRSKYESFIEGNFEEYLLRLEDPQNWVGEVEISALALIYRHDFIIFQEPGKPPVNITENSFSDKVRLCFLNGNHYDSVYPMEFVNKAALCQSILYELLYEKVYGVDRSVVSACLKNSRHPGPDGFGECKSSEESDLEEEDDFWPSDAVVPTNMNSHRSSNNNPHYKKSHQSRMILSHRVRMSLNPWFFRNVEYDVWLRSKRAQQKRDFCMAAGMHYTVGDKCKVRLDNTGKFFRAYIQAVDPGNGPVTVFIEELGEKHSIPLWNLRPPSAVDEESWSTVAERGKRVGMVNGNGHHPGKSPRSADLAQGPPGRARAASTPQSTFLDRESRGGRKQGKGSPALHGSAAGPLPRVYKQHSWPPHATAEEQAADGSSRAVARKGEQLAPSGLLQESCFGLSSDERLALEEEQKSQALLEIMNRDEKSFPALRSQGGPRAVGQGGEAGRKQMPHAGERRAYRRRGDLQEPSQDSEDNLLRSVPREEKNKFLASAQPGCPAGAQRTQPQPSPESSTRTAVTSVPALAVSTPAPAVSAPSCTPPAPVSALAATPCAPTPHASTPTAASSAQTPTLPSSSAALPTPAVHPTPATSSPTPPVSAPRPVSVPAPNSAPSAPASTVSVPRFAVSAPPTTVSAPAPAAASAPAPAAASAPPTTISAPAPATVSAPSPATVSAPSPATVSAPSPATVSAPAPATVSAPSPATVSVRSPATVSAPSPATVSAPSPAAVSAPSPAAVSAPLLAVSAPTSAPSATPCTPTPPASTSTAGSAAHMPTPSSASAAPITTAILPTPPPALPAGYPPASLPVEPPPYNSASPCPPGVISQLGMVPGPSPTPPVLSEHLSHPHAHSPSLPPHGPLPFQQMMHLFQDPLYPGFPVNDKDEMVNVPQYSYARNGQDLPREIGILRFFFNLGIKAYTNPSWPPHTYLYQLQQAHMTACAIQPKVPFLQTWYPEGPPSGSFRMPIPEGYGQSPGYGPAHSGGRGPGQFEHARCPVQPGVGVAMVGGALGPQSMDMGLGSEGRPPVGYSPQPGVPLPPQLGGLPWPGPRPNPYPGPYSTPPPGPQQYLPQAPPYPAVSLGYHAPRLSCSAQPSMTAAQVGASDGLAGRAVSHPPVEGPPATSQERGRGPEKQPIPLSTPASLPAQLAPPAEVVMVTGGVEVRLGRLTPELPGPVTSPLPHALRVCVTDDHRSVQVDQAPACENKSEEGVNVARGGGPREGSTQTAEPQDHGAAYSSGEVWEEEGEAGEEALQGGRYYYGRSYKGKRGQDGARGFRDNRWRGEGRGYRGRRGSDDRREYNNYRDRRAGDGSPNYPSSHKGQNSRGRGRGYNQYPNGRETGYTGVNQRNNAYAEP